MKAAPHTATITAIRGKIAEYHAAAEEFGKDVTLATAREALAAVEKSKELADREDDSIDPEELVDQRLEAARQVEVAKIRVSRAEKAHASRQGGVISVLHEALKIAEAAFPVAVETLREKLTAGALRVYGAEIVEIHEKSHFGTLHYRMCERVLGVGRNLGKMISDNPQQLIAALERAISTLEDAHRDR